MWLIRQKHAWVTLIENRVRTHTMDAHMQALTLFVHRAIKVTTTSVINGDILLIE
jgi:hypothetical protein